jgi:hypothetical protein
VIFLMVYRVARWFVFQPKIPIWVNFGGPKNRKCWYILRSFGIFYGQCCGNLVHFPSFWYIVSRKTWRPWWATRSKNVAFRHMCCYTHVFDFFYQIITEFGNYRLGNMFEKRTTYQVGITSSSRMAFKAKSTKMYKTRSRPDSERKQRRKKNRKRYTYNR